MKAAILGFGTVGSGVYEVLNMNSERIAKVLGEPLSVKYVLDLRDFPGNPVSKVLTHNFDDIVNDPEVDVIAEVMGGCEPAYTFSKKAILAGKSVCTSNKELVSRHGAELLRLAKENNVNYFFEASVGGGIPIIRPMNKSLCADEIVEMMSIVNGTTNYILSGMRREGLSFETALKQAQEKGFAERNPAADIEGLDAARKTAILASLANRMQVECEDVYTEGITNISERDIAYAQKLGRRIKLISYVKRENGKNFAMVSPRLIPENDLLYNIEGVVNALKVTGNAVGEIMFNGSGAGKLPTASAVCADLTEAALYRHEHVPTLWSEEILKLTDKKELVSSFFVRVSACDEKAAREAFEISETVEPEDNEFVFVTKPMSEGNFDKAAGKVKIINRIRM